MPLRVVVCPVSAAHKKAPGQRLALEHLPVNQIFINLYLFGGMAYIILKNKKPVCLFFMPYREMGHRPEDRRWEYFVRPDMRGGVTWGANLCGGGFSGVRHGAGARSWI